jgi:hypothetical protein
MPKDANVGVVTKQRLQNFVGVVFAAVIDKENLKIPLSRQFVTQ